MDTNKLKQSVQKTYNNFKQSLPILLGIILLLALIQAVIPHQWYSEIFTGNQLFDPVFGAMIGSIAAGNPATSYIIGGQLLEEGISLVAVTSFILAWVTVGIVQLPAESLMLGKKFAITRNIVAFISAIIIAILVTFTLSLL